MSNVRSNFAYPNSREQALGIANKEAIPVADTTGGSVPFGSPLSNHQPMKTTSRRASPGWQGLSDSSKMQTKRALGPPASSPKAGPGDTDQESGIPGGRTQLGYNGVLSPYLPTHPILYCQTDRIGSNEGLLMLTSVFYSTSTSSPRKSRRARLSTLAP